MDNIENGMYETKYSFNEIHKSFPIHFGQWGGEFLMLIVTHLYCNKYSEINIFHYIYYIYIFITFFIQLYKSRFWKGSHKRFLIYNGLCLKTARYVFQIVFRDLFLSYKILMHSVMAENRAKVHPFSKNLYAFFK